MNDRQFQNVPLSDMDPESFLARLEDYMRTGKKLSESSIRIYLGRIRRLLDDGRGCSVGDLCGESHRLWEDYGPEGSRYDPNDHGNTRAAIGHVDDLVRMDLLEQAGNLTVSYDMGWSSFRDKEKCESGYTIRGDRITFSYRKGFTKSKDVVKKISTSNLRELICLFEIAYEKGCFAASNTCLNSVHGKQCCYDYTFADVSGNDCRCLFEGNDWLNKQYADLLDRLRA